MPIAGIICEYNPLHLGHLKQISAVRKLLGMDTTVVCIMSGNFVQRGHPAIFDKSLRARAAVLCGADLVLEMPLQACLSSAEGFADAGVRLLSPICTHLCFGAENAGREALMHTAGALLSEPFRQALRVGLDKGLSFPAARQQALEKLGCDSALLNRPNNILATEYCKAILARQSPLVPLPIFRDGDYHDAVPDRDNPSATALRAMLLSGGSWESYVPEQAVPCFRNAAIHTLQAGEGAILYRLRTMTEEDFAALPYGSEGLWRKLMHCAREKATLDEILTAVKSKRYTRTRLDRMVMCAALGLTAADLAEESTCVRVLAFTDRGRAIVRDAKSLLPLYNAGAPCPEPYRIAEQRAGSLYGLFAVRGPEPPDAEKTRRIFYKRA